MSELENRDIVPPEDTAANILKIIQQAKAPLTAEKILLELADPSKIDIKRLRKILNEHIRAGAIHKWPPKGKDRYWIQDPEEYGRKKFLEFLSGKRLSLSELENALRSILFDCSKTKAHELRKKFLKEFLKNQQVFEHPKTGRERMSKYSLTPPDPARYIKKVSDEFNNVCNKLKKYGVSRDRIFQAITHVLDPSEKAALAIKDPPRPPKPEVQPSQDISKMILDKVLEIQPAARQHALVSLRTVRAELDLPKEDFDEAILSLSKAEKIFLHRHVYPDRLDEEELDELVTDGRGNYYMGIVLRS